jgi:hypothetical protein
MARFDSDDQLVRALGADLTPVSRLAPPSLRVLLWLAIVTAVAVTLAMVCDLDATVGRLTAAPDLWVAATGSMLTAVLAAVAAFQLSHPDRKPIWALLPLPAAVLWISASGIGCLRPWVAAQTHPMSPGEPENCLIFILGLSVPLSVLLIIMLRRGYSLRPNLTAIVGGLACASAAATLLNFVHPYDAAASDLSVHAFAVGVVILANSVFGGRILAGKKLLPSP